jgi:hypothetical protein
MGRQSAADDLRRAKSAIESQVPACCQEWAKERAQLWGKIRRSGKIWRTQGVRTLTPSSIRCSRGLSCPSNGTRRSKERRRQDSWYWKNKARLEDLAETICKADESLVVPTASTVSLGDIRRHRDGGSIHLRGKPVNLITGKGLGERVDGLGQFHRIPAWAWHRGFGGRGAEDQGPHSPARSSKTPAFAAMIAGDGAVLRRQVPRIGSRGVPARHSKTESRPSAAKAFAPLRLPSRPFLDARKYVRPAHP